MSEHQGFEDGVIDVPEERVYEPSGMPRNVRKERYPELFRYYFDPDQLVSDPKPPDWVMVAFRELIGKEPEFKIAWHPGFKRYGAFQRYRRPDRQTDDHVYHCFMLAMGLPREGYLPVDLDTPDKRHENLRGLIGDFRQFDRRDFEVALHYADRWHNSIDTLDARFAALDAAVEHEKDRKIQDFEWDRLDYNYLRLNTVANNGTKQYSVPAVADAKENPRRYRQRTVEGVQGTKIKVFDRRLDATTEAEREQRENDERESFYAQVEWKVREEQRRKRHEAYMEQAKNLLVGEIKQRRSL